MARLPGEPDKRLATIERVLALIGRATANWATLEFYINEVIWGLAETPPAYGACITAQIFTIDGRLKALLALLKLRRANTKTIKSVNRFVEAARGPSEKRNRMAHDAWGFGTKSGAPSKIEVTADKKLVFRLRAVDINELKKDVREIEECVVRFVGIRDQILAELPSLPDIPPSELRPISEGPRRRQT
ncbi:MAG: hypothetical protein IH999_08070 [Proteobacteria bacterium]|nr:hypothetical protein [Pseudomonadota bacterium]